MYTCVCECVCTSANLVFVVAEFVVVGAFSLLHSQTKLFVWVVRFWASQHCSTMLDCCVVPLFKKCAHRKWQLSSHNSASQSIYHVHMYVHRYLVSCRNVYLLGLLLVVAAVLLLLLSVFLLLIYLSTTIGYCPCPTTQR